MQNKEVRRVKERLVILAKNQYSRRISSFMLFYSIVQIQNEKMQTATTVVILFLNKKRDGLCAKPRWAAVQFSQWFLSDCSEAGRTAASDRGFPQRNAVKGWNIFSDGNCRS